MQWVVTILMVAFTAASFADDNQNCLDQMGERWRILQKKLREGEVKPISRSLNGETLYLNGEINAAMAKEFVKTVAIDGNRVRFVVVNSPGGNVVEGKKIADWIFERGPHLRVSVPYNGICASMCTHLLACGEETSADQTALFMYHPAAMSAQSRSRLEKELGEGPLAALVPQILAGLVTVGLDNDKCAKGHQSEGQRRAIAATAGGETVCFSGAKVQSEYPGLILRIEKTGSGMLDDPPGRRTSN